MNSEILFQISSSRDNTRGVLLVYTMQGALMDHLFQKFIQGLSVPPLYWRAQQCKAHWSSQRQLVVEGRKHIEQHSPRLIHRPRQMHLMNNSWGGISPSAGQPGMVSIEQC